MPPPAVPPSNLVCLSPHPTLLPHLSLSDPPPLPSSAALHPTPPPFPDALLDPEYPTSEDEPDVPSPHLPAFHPPELPHPPHPTSIPSPRPPPPPRTPPPQRSATPLDISPWEQPPYTPSTCLSPRGHRTPAQPPSPFPPPQPQFTPPALSNACGRRSPITIKPPLPARHLHRLSCTPSGPVDRTIHPPSHSFRSHPSCVPQRSSPVVEICHILRAIEHDPAASLMDRLLGDYRSLLSFASVINLRVDQLEPSQSGYETIGTVAYARTAHTHVPVLTGEAIPPHLDPLTRLQSVCIALYLEPQNAQVSDDGARYLPTFEPSPQAPDPHPLKHARRGMPPLSLPEHSALVMLLASTRPEVQTALAAAVRKDKYSQPENTVAAYHAVSQGHAAYEVCHNLDSRVAVGPFGIHLHWDDKTWQNKNRTLMRAIEVTEMEFPLSLHQGNLLPGEVWCHRNASETKLKRAPVMLHEFKIRVMNAHHRP
ncbi:hypothetical protein K439DRAFT_1616618 [Ramaria rubella]|nr:hypothetical protein K439DRAFT_1616618 [Ramaria rubella]